MSGHLLHVEATADHTPKKPDWSFSIQCVKPESCGGWQECGQPHGSGTLSADLGPWEADPLAPWGEEEEFTFHGVLHEWRYGYGWTVPYDGCPVADSLNWSNDDAWDIARHHGVGTHVVQDEWDDTSCSLIWIRGS